MSATTNTQRPYEYLNDEALRAHYESVLDQGESVADELRLRAGQKSTSVWSTWTLADIASELHRLADSDLQSLVTAWSTHGGLISAELARRAATQATRSFNDQRSAQAFVDEQVRQATKMGFADMLKAHNPAEDAGFFDRLLKDVAEQPDDPFIATGGPKIRRIDDDDPGPEADEPEDFSMFTSAELLTAYEALVRDFKACIGEGRLGMARELREEWWPIKAEIVRRDDAQ